MSTILLRGWRWVYFALALLALACPCMAAEIPLQQSSAPGPAIAQVPAQAGLHPVFALTPEQARAAAKRGAADRWDFLRSSARYRWPELVKSKWWKMIGEGWVVLRVPEYQLEALAWDLAEDLVTAEQLSSGAWDEQKFPENSSARSAFLKVQAFTDQVVTQRPESLNILAVKIGT